MSISAVKIIGAICSIAICDVTFPIAKVPYDTIASEMTTLHPVVQLSSGGALEGYIMKTVRGRHFMAFEGVPYAEAPLGHLRFQNPIKKIPWTGTRDATKPGPVCMQMEPTKYYNVIGHEDCLYLNVYVPMPKTGNPQKIMVNTDPLPVMIWIHGGSFYHGSGSYYGPSYLLDRDVILVTLNYRLGALGFMSTGDSRLPGNLGLKDQSMAIDWVRENVPAFGGDIKRITLFGQSAGAASVHLHMMSGQGFKGLFGAISQSGNAFNRWTFPPNVTGMSHKLANSLGCHSEFKIVDCLQRLSAREVVAAQYGLFEWMEHPAVLLGPVIEHVHKDAFITQSPEMLYLQGKVPRIPWITGVTSDEGDLFGVTTYLAGTASMTILQNPQLAMPHILMYNSDDEDTTRRIMNSYMNTSRISIFEAFNALKPLSRMIGDSFFYVPMDKAVRIHAEMASSPVFAYFLSHRGQHGITEKFLVPPSEWGVMHLDDLQYLFNISQYFYPLSPSDKDYQIVDYMTEFWSNFATFGIPIAKYGVKWPPAMFLSDKMQLLDLKRDPRMIPQPYLNRINFWKKDERYYGLPRAAYSTNAI